MSGWTSGLCALLALATLFAPVPAAARQDAPAEQIRNEAEQALERGDIQRDAPLAERVRRHAETIAKDPSLQLEPPTPKAPSPPPSNIPFPSEIVFVLLVAVIAVALAIVGYHLYRTYAPGRRISKTTHEAVVVAAQPIARSTDAPLPELDEIERLARAGAYAEAIHLMLLRALEALRRRLGASWAKSLTSREIVRRTELPASDRSALTMLVGAVEISRFGGQSANEQIYRACLDQYRLIGEFRDGHRMSGQGEAAARRSGELFSPRTLLAIIAIGTAAFVGMIYLEMFGGGDPEFEIGPSTYSSSALGHKALVETLRRLDVPVVVSRFRTAEKAGQGSLLVLAEPDDSETSKELLANLRAAPHGLLVLPKWDGSRDVSKPRWVGSMGMVQEETVEAVLEAAQIDALVKRVDGTFTLDVPTLGGQIELTNPQVIIDSQGLKPVVSFKGGILIGEAAHGSERQWVLSDPDLIANHGIDQGDNAVVAVSIVESLRPAGGVVIFDETIHGLELRPNLMRTAFELPFGIVTLSAAVAVALAIWAGLMRFGRPDPAQRALQPGKITLIRTTADLLRQGSRKGTVELVLTRYLKAQIADLVARLNGPRGLSENRQIARLDDLAVARRLGARLQPLAATIEATARSHSTDPGRALRLAADLHAWKQEFLYGLAKGSSDR